MKQNNKTSNKTKIHNQKKFIIKPKQEKNTPKNRTYNKPNPNKINKNDYRPKPNYKKIKSQPENNKKNKTKIAIIKTGENHT